MPLVKEKELLAFAEERHFAVPGFFPFNLDFIKPIIEAAEEEHSPVVLCQGPEFIDSFGANVFTEACKTAAHYAKVPVALSVDHTFVTDDTTIPWLIRIMCLGWSSFMVDASLLSYEENKTLTKRLADICKDADVSSVAALGEVRRFFPQAMKYSGPYQDDFTVPPEIMTDPEQAREFVEYTGVDTLAISIGQYVRSLWDGELPPFKKYARLDFERLEKIREKTSAHLILHGATHVREEDLSEAAGKGISMIKVASEQALIWSNAIRNFVTGHPDIMFPEDIQKPALAAVKESMRNYIRLFHANGQIK